MDKAKIIKTVVLLAAISIIVGGILRILQKNSMSLADYEKLNGTENAGTGSDGPEIDENDSLGDEVPTGNNKGQGEAPTDNNKDNDEAAMGNNKDGEAPTDNNQINEEAAKNNSQEDPESIGAENLQNPSETITPVSLLIGASLNGSSQLEYRNTHEEGFYYEPISDELRRYITGISYPSTRTPSNAAESGEDNFDTDFSSSIEITLDELRYVHILHYDFDGNPAEGELICNEYIAQDLVEIFYQLYSNEYQLEKVLLIDEYDGDDTASMEDNNTSCFNYRTVPGKTSLSKHSYGLAIDINPLYNPYITYNKDGTMNVSPASGESYADRTLNFPYKIDEEDLCYKLFIKHGFTWGGSWNHSKDYQHFQKAKP